MTSTRLSSDASLVFHTVEGRVQGWRDGSVVRATGIPYATAGRFEKPVPVTHHTEDPLPALSFSPMAPQVAEEAATLVYGPELRDLGVDENCQRVSVTVPADLREGELLPVIVWIHGGTYIAGSGDSSFHEHAALVAEQRVVVVTVTYRLGILGFLHSSNSPANLGLLDQEEALRWVRRNIEAFGGDPRNVTALGESAGADAIAHHMASMGARSRRHPDAPEDLLFDRAVLLSPPLGIRKGRSRMNAAMAKLVDAAVDHDTSTDEILRVQGTVFGAMARYGLPGMMPFGVQYEHEPLPAEHEVEACWEAIAPRIPVLISTVATEASLFGATVPWARTLTNQPVVGERLFWAVVKATSNLVFVKPSTEFAELIARAGGKAHRAVIGWWVPGNPIKGPHAIDIALLFSTPETWERMAPFAGSTWAEVDAASRELRRYVTDFARGTDHPLTRDARVVRGYGASQ